MMILPMARNCCGNIRARQCGARSRIAPLAAAILATTDSGLAARLEAWRARQTAAVAVAKTLAERLGIPFLNISLYDIGLNPKETDYFSMMDYTIGEFVKAMSQHAR